MKPKPVVALGDSITRGHTLRAEETWVHFLNESLKQRLGENAPEVINAGGNGHTSREGLARIQADVLDHKPGLVLVEFGGNDAGHNPIDYPEKHVTLAEFERNLKKTHELVTGVGGRVVFMTFPPIIEAQRPNGGYHPYFVPHGGPDAFIGIYRESTRRIARELRAGLFDLDAFIREMIKVHGVGEIMAEDGVHLTVKCNRLVAKAVEPVVV